MRLTVHVKPRSKKPGIEKVNDHEWIVRVREAPVDGRANAAVVAAVAAELGIPKSRVQLLHGESSRQKLLSIE